MLAWDHNFKWHASELKTCYDYIVVGSGASGNTATMTLAIGKPESNTL